MIIKWEAKMSAVALCKAIYLLSCSIVCYGINCITYLVFFAAVFCSLGPFVIFFIKMSVLLLKFNSGVIFSLLLLPFVFCLISLLQVFHSRTRRPSDLQCFTRWDMGPKCALCKWQCRARMEQFLITCLVNIQYSKNPIRTPRSNMG